MNTYKFCKELEKIFGRYQSKRIENRELFLVEGLLYLHPIPVFCFLFSVFCMLTCPFPNLRSYLEMIASTCFLFVTVFTVVLENDLEKTGKRVVWRPTLRDKTYTSVFLHIVMLDTYFVRIFSECRLTFEFVFYETVILNIELYLCRKIEKNNLDREMSINTENLFRKNEDFGRNYSSFDCKSLHNRR